MSGFTSEWLALREAADAQARAASLCENLPSPAVGLRIADLGAGTGNNLRYLAPRLGGAQRWTLIDLDAALLSSIAAPDAGKDLIIETKRLDLARELNAVDLAGCDLVTASAFFDLVSGDWIKRFATACRDASVPRGLFALNYDGRIGWTPEEPEDAWIAQLFHRHMHRDKGFGVATGPESARVLEEAFRIAGYQARSADSPWRLSPADATLQVALLENYAGAAIELAPEQSLQIADWERRRLAHLVARGSTLLVGHHDVLVSRL